MDVNYASNWPNITYLLLILVLVFRPNGLFGRGGVNV